MIILGATCPSSQGKAAVVGGVNSDEKTRPSKERKLANQKQDDEAGVEGRNPRARMRRLGELSGLKISHYDLVQSSRSIDGMNSIATEGSKRKQAEKKAHNIISSTLVVDRASLVDSESSQKQAPSC